MRKFTERAVYRAFRRSRSDLTADSRAAIEKRPNRVVDRRRFLEFWTPPLGPDVLGQGRRLASRSPRAVAESDPPSRWCERRYRRSLKFEHVRSLFQGMVDTDPFGRAIRDQHLGDRTEPLLDRDGDDVREHRIEEWYFGAHDGDAWRDRWMAGRGLQTLISQRSGFLRLKPEEDVNRTVDSLRTAPRLLRERLR